MNAPVKPVEVLEEPVSVRSDAQHPLAHRFPNDWVPAALAQSVDDLQCTPRQSTAPFEQGARQEKNSAAAWNSKHAPLHWQARSRARDTN